MLSFEEDMSIVIHTILSALSVHWVAGDETISSQLEAKHPDLASPFLPTVRDLLHHAEA